MSKMNWNRARKSGAAYGHSGEDRSLERAVNRILFEPARPSKGKRYSSHSKRRSPADQIAEGLNEALALVRGAPLEARYRAVGAVVFADGEYRAVDAGGKVLGTYPTREEAWRHADELGMQPI